MLGVCWQAMKFLRSIRCHEDISERYICHDYLVIHPRPSGDERRRRTPRHLGSPVASEYPVMTNMTDEFLSYSRDSANWLSPARVLRGDMSAQKGVRDEHYIRPCGSANVGTWSHVRKLCVTERIAPEVDVARLERGADWHPGVSVPRTRN